MKKTFEEWKEEFLKYNPEIDKDKLLKRLFYAESDNHKFSMKYECWNNGSPCEECKHCHTVGDGKSEPFSYECEEDSDQLGFEEGCSNFERRKDY